MFVLFVVFSLSLFLTSSWHRHNRFSSQPCEFSHLEHGAWSEDSAQPVLVEPPAESTLQASIADPGGLESRALAQGPVRAPPIVL
jgi:hypothetical protein